MSQKRLHTSIGQLLLITVLLGQSCASGQAQTDTSLSPPGNVVTLDADALYPQNSLLAQQMQGESSEHGDLDVLSKNILAKELELLKLNTRYRAESTRSGKWKPWRQSAYALAANVVINVGIDHICYARWKYWRRPSLATKPFLRKGPICLLTGHSILAAGVLLESTLDFLNDRKLKSKGFDRATCHQRVLTLREEIDQLVLTREQAIERSAIAGTDREILDAETKVLKDIRNCALDEFAKFAGRHAKWKTARNTSNAMILANAATGGYLGSLGNLLAVNNRRPRLALPAGVGFVVSGACIALTVPTTRIVSTIVSKRETAKERSALGGVLASSQSDFDHSRQALETLVHRSEGSVSANVRKRLAVYEKQNEALDSVSVLAKNEAKAANKEFIEKLIVGAATGGTKMAWGTNLIVAGSAWSNTAPRAARSIPVKINGKIFRITPSSAKTPAQMFSRRVAQGATCQVVGSSIGALDVLQSRIRGELRNTNAKNAGTAPGQVMGKRMKTLESAESLL